VLSIGYDDAGWAESCIEELLKQKGLFFEISMGNYLKFLEFMLARVQKY